MTAALKLVAECPYEFSFRVKDKNRRVIFLVLTSFMNYVKIIVFVDSDIVGSLPRVLFRELCPVVINSIGIFTITKDYLFGMRFAGGENGGSKRTCCRCCNELATAHRN